MNSNHKHIITNGILSKLIDYKPINENNFKIIYEVFRVDDFIPLFLQEHLDRLFKGIKQSSLENSLDHYSIKDQITELITKENIGHGNIKISCFCDESSICNYTISFIPSYYPSKEMYENGVDAILFEGERHNPGIKIANTNIRRMANKELDKKGAFEALLVNHDNLITEGSRTNVFFIKQDTIYTAPTELVLPGIMRSKVIEVIEENNYKINYTPISIDQLINIESAFFTGTSPRILPISSIGNITLNVKVPLLRELMELLNSKINNYKTAHKKP